MASRIQQRYFVGANTRNVVNHVRTTAPIFNCWTIVSTQIRIKIYTRKWHAMGLLQIRKIAGCACAGNAGNVFPATDFKGNQPLVSDTGMHHGTCATHVPWCMSVSLTVVVGKTFTAFQAHAQPAFLRVWQEAHIALSRASYGAKTVNSLETAGRVITKLLTNCSSIIMLDLRCTETESRFREIFIKIITMT